MINLKNKGLPSLYIWLGVAAVIVVLLLWFVGTYNHLVGLDQTAENKWADVETQYQRRADLIPNLVSTVKAYAKQELTVFTEVTALRSQWASATTREEKIAAAENMDKGFNTADPTSALSRLMVVVENYPDLKSSANFLSLQDQLEGTENRVAVSRNNFNEAVKNYNIAVNSIPTNMIAGMFGYKEKAFFKAAAGSENAPNVNFQ